MTDNLKSNFGQQNIFIKGHAHVFGTAPHRSFGLNFEGQGYSNSYTPELRFHNESEEVCDDTNHQNRIFRDHNPFYYNGTITLVRKVETDYQPLPEFSEGKKN